MAWMISPSNEEMAFLMEAGFLLCDLRKHDEARQIFHGARALAPKSEAPEVALGMVAFQEGDFENAGKHYRRAIELNPRSAWALAHLGELAIFGMGREEAQKYLKAAIELDPRGPHGKFARALVEFANAVTFE
jgi:Flp pilus assembly protein TadD